MSKKALLSFGLLCLVCSTNAIARSAEIGETQKAVNLQSEPLHDDFALLLEKEFAAMRRSWDKQPTAANAPKIASDVNATYAEFQRHLSTNQAVSDRSILTMRDMFSFLDQAVNRLEGYPLTLRYIKDIIPRISENKLSRLALMNQLANMQSRDPLMETSINSYESALSANDELYLKLLCDRMQLKYDLANKYFEAGLKEKALAEIAPIIGFDWFNMKDPESFQFLREKYQEAMLLRIRINAGDTQALKDIRYYPAFESTIGPALRAAVQTAEANDELMKK